MADVPPQGSAAPLTSEQLLGAFDQILHPPPTLGRKYFKRIGLAVVGLVLLTVLFLASPFVPDSWACGVSARLLSVTGSKETAEHFCDWLAIISQIGIVVFIGGAAFTEAFARKVAGMATKLQQTTIEAELRENDARRAALRTTYNRLVASFAAEGKSQVEKVKDAVGAVSSLYADARTLPDRYIMLGARGLLFNFPGGLYGFLGFILLLVQAVAVTTKILLDYLPASCAVH